MKEFVIIKKAPMYEINVDGVIRRAGSDCTRKWSTDQFGFQYCVLRMGYGRGCSVKHIKRHMELAEAFIPKTRDNEKHVIFLDQDKTNFSLDNLKWATREEYLAHSTEGGFYSTRKSTATLLSPTDEVVHIKGIRAFCREHKLSYRNIQNMISKNPILTQSMTYITIKNVKGWRLAE